MLVHITADSPCDLPDDIVKARNITITPLYLHFGNEAAKDGAEISGREVIESYEQSGILPKTAAPSVGDYLSAWQPLLKNGDEVLHFSLSSGISSAYQSARIAAMDCGNVQVIDSEQMCGAFGLMVLYACDLRDIGLTVTEIAAETQIYSENLFTAFLIYDAMFLLAGGRGTAIEEAGKVYYPSVTTIDGKISPLAKYSGNIHKARECFINDILERNSKNYERVVLVYTTLSQEEFLPLLKILETSGRFGEIITCETGGVISAHCGKGTVGIFF